MLLNKNHSPMYKVLQLLEYILHTRVGVGPFYATPTRVGTSPKKEECIFLITFIYSGGNQYVTALFSPCIGSFYRKWAEI